MLIEIEMQRVRGIADTLIHHAGTLHDEQKSKMAEKAMRIARRIEITPMAVAHFRTLPSGEYKYMRRGYWRVLMLPNRHSARTLSAKGVSEIVRYRDGLDGVTPRSRYYIGNCAIDAHNYAAAINGDAP